MVPEAISPLIRPFHGSCAVQCVLPDDGEDGGDGYNILYRQVNCPSAAEFLIPRNMRGKKKTKRKKCPADVKCACWMDFREVFLPI